MAHDLKNPVLLAVIGAAHGIRGELRVKTFTADPQALGDYGPLVAADGRPFTIASLRPAKDVAVVRFREVADRNAAEALAGTELFVDRSALPDDLEEDEFYLVDLVGLAVRDGAGARLGTVAAIHDFGGGDILEMKRQAGGTVMIPFTREAVPAVSLADGFVTVDPAAAGLVDAQDDEPGEEPAGGRSRA